MWKCPKCKREFERKDQVHSCKSYPLEKHFKNKPEAEKLFKKLKVKMKKEIGSIKVESLPCCIHFLSDYTFSAVYAMKGKIRVTFSLDEKLKGKRFERVTEMSPKRYLHALQVDDAKDFDRELMGWLKRSYKLKKKR
jgi:hypothetical protein